MQQSHVHHYVPQWYQRRFLAAGTTQYFYLDLHPETVVQDGVSHQRRALLKWGPAKCFYKDNLYTLTFGHKTSDVMEKLFFGMVDTRGREAVARLADYQGFAPGVADALRDLVPYMGAQRFRTPRGLDEIKKRTSWVDPGPNAALNALQ